MIALCEEPDPQTVIEMIARGYTLPIVLAALLFGIWRVIKRSFPWIEALVKSHIEFVRALQSSQLDIRDRLTAIEEAITRRSGKRRREDPPEDREVPR